MSSSRTLEYFRRAHVGRFVGWGVPDGLQGPLQVATNYCNWLFAFDDAVCDERLGGSTPGSLATYLTRMARMLETPTVPMLRDDKWAMSLLDIQLTLAAHATPAQVYRWVDQVQDYFTGLVWEAAIRETGEIASLSDYIMMWQKNSATLSALAFIEVAGGYVLTAEEVHDPRVHALQDISAALVGWCNDIVSYNKEAFREQHFGFPEIQNLVPVLADEQGCSIDEAARQAVVMHDTAMRRLAELSEQVCRQAGPGLSCFVEGLCQWVRGSLEWHLTTDRYADPNDPGEPVADHVAMPAVLASPTTAAGPGALEVPAVAWWWDC
ncbi:terpene synthase family protein [Streptomyces roseoverticillatus]|uniref:Terpene synthase n=1 Tax=Streptomyces roseoverticillatus TaxID=66429 RepID=A0ABV3IX73_9ACTN